jgi:hypothetical protein
MPRWGLASPGAPIMTGLPDMGKIGGGRGGSTMLNGTGLMSGLRSREETHCRSTRTQLASSTK